MVRALLSPATMSLCANGRRHVPAGLSIQVPHGGRAVTHIHAVHTITWFTATLSQTATSHAYRVTRYTVVESHTCTHSSWITSHSHGQNTHSQTYTHHSSRRALTFGCGISTHLTLSQTHGQHAHKIYTYMATPTLVITWVILSS